MISNLTNEGRPYRISAVLFDFDGTLTQPGALDFNIIKNDLDCPLDTPVLEYIESIADTQVKSEYFNKLNRFERQGAANSLPNPGAENLVRMIQSKRIPQVLITRNSLASIAAALQNFEDLNLDDFNLVITRDDPVAPKPDPDGILLAARKLKVQPHEMLMVGDYIFDIQAGQNAGALTALLDVDPRIAPDDLAPDFVVSRLDEIIPIIQMGAPLPQGKLPNDLLADFLNGFSFEDPDLLIKAGVGEDIAAADIQNKEVLILKSDPITFATDAIGHYAVLVNANDIATCGADPRWLLTTLLFPSGTSGSEIQYIMRGLHQVAEQYGITLCGGHTEITDAVTRPVVVGSLVGTVSRESLVDKKSMQTGDKILFTKAVAVEGTAIIAREMADKLFSMGFSHSEVETCRRFLDRISILEEARIACRVGGVSAMHDVTEGGLATAVRELSIAGHHRLRIDMGSIPIYPQTQRISDKLDIAPLGLIGSGSLLICCHPNVTDDMLAAIQEAGIDVTCIGEVLEPGEGIEALQGLQSAQWPEFAVDELARLFA